MSSALPLFSVGVLSDVQYADREPTGSSRYRAALRHLAEAIECFNAQPLAAVTQLGDLVDSNPPAHVDAALQPFARCRHPVWHLLGNHDFLGPQAGDAMARLLGLADIGRHGQRLRREGWRLVVIDSLEISTQSSAPGSAAHTLAEHELEQLRAVDAPWGQLWNGRAGEQQLAELDALLSDADGAGERVLLLSHLPAHPDSASERHLCWNHVELRSMLATHPSVFAHFNGHDHHGGFCTDGSIHYLTLPALCDSADGRGAHAIAHFYPDRIELEGWGRVLSRVLR